MNDKIKAVITCDLINSSKYSPEDRAAVYQRMSEFVTKKHKKDLNEFLIYRGDSIQGLMSDPSQALSHALYLKSYIKSIKLNGNKRTTNADIRISIGIGSIDFTGNSLLESDGQAFQNSGRTLDKLKKRGRTIALTTTDEKQNAVWDVILTLLEDVIGQWTIQSAEIIWRLIDGWEDKKIQDDLQISQPAVSQRKKHASWDAIEKTIKYYEDHF